jgi:hypothetical protein
MHAIARKIRARRDEASFDRALRTAGPSMRQELAAAAARTEIQMGTRRTSF